MLQCALAARSRLWRRCSVDALTVGMPGPSQCGQEVEDEERRQFEVAALDRFKLAGKVGIDSNELFSCFC